MAGEITFRNDLALACGFRLTSVVVLACFRPDLRWSVAEVSRIIRGGTLIEEAESDTRPFQWAKPLRLYTI